MRAWLRRIADEHVPAGTGWSFTLGMVLLFGLVVQVVTGIALALYYAPTPDHAWMSVRYIMTDVRFGPVVRGLHFWGATLVVVSAALHLVRVVVTGSYRKPRQFNWVIGLALLVVILFFAMSGYLLPWDQRGYWATVVRVGIAGLTPFLGEFAKNMMRGGPDIGALTLMRWYALHVMVLPLALIGLVTAHMYFRFRDGLSGPVKAGKGTGHAYYPFHVSREMLAMLAAGVLLVVLAIKGMPALEPQADPTATDYIPRPEWYFAGLFQFVKLFPGKWEVVGALILPGIAMTALILLPWLDRGRTRAFADRRPVLVVFMLFVAVVATLTTIGAMDQPARQGDAWNHKEIAGVTLMATDRCARCHKPDGVAAPIEGGRISRPQDWLVGHVADPDMIAPGLRDTPASNDRETEAILAGLAKLRGGPMPAVSDTEKQMSLILSRHCLSCHSVDGVGSKTGDNLTHIGSKRTVAELAQRITNPKILKPNTEMPAFESKLSAEEIAALAAWLAAHK